MCAAFCTPQELLTKCEHFFPTGSAQVTIRCFTSESNCQTATDPEFDAVTIEECCLSTNGTFFEDAGNCIACIGMSNSSGVIPVICLWAPDIYYKTAKILE